MTVQAGTEKKKRGLRKNLEGVVVSDKMSKTVVVAVKRTVQHKRYKKIIRIIKRFKAHDALDQCKVGDRVRIVETRPISKDKTWRVVRILNKEDDS